MRVMHDQKATGFINVNFQSMKDLSMKKDKLEIEELIS